MSKITCWGIKMPYGGRYSIPPYYMATTRRDAIGIITFNTGRSWETLRRAGYSAVKLKVTEV